MVVNYNTRHLVKFFFRSSFFANDGPVFGTSGEFNSGRDVQPAPVPPRFLADVRKYSNGYQAAGLSSPLKPGETHVAIKLDGPLVDSQVASNRLPWPGRPPDTQEAVGGAA